MTAAMAPVMTKVATVVPMILPARFMLFMLAMEPAMDTNTSGTTTQNIMLMNTVPKGFSTVAAPGASQPTIAPMTIAPSMMPRNI